MIPGPISSGVPFLYLLTHFSVLARTSLCISMLREQEEGERESERESQRGPKRKSVESRRLCKAHRRTRGRPIRHLWPITSDLSAGLLSLSLSLSLSLLLSFFFLSLSLPLSLSLSAMLIAVVIKVREGLDDHEFASAGPGFWLGWARSRIQRQWPS